MLVLAFAYNFFFFCRCKSNCCESDSKLEYFTVNKKGMKEAFLTGIVCLCRVKPKTDVHVAMAPPVMAAVEALPTHAGEQQPQQQQQPSQPLPSQAQHLSQAIPTLLAPPVQPPPSQPAAVLSALPAAMAVTPSVPASMANAVASPTQPAASGTAVCAISSTCPELKVKQEVEAMDTSQPGTHTAVT